MSNLISRLEALTEPSWEVDAEVALANGWTKGDPNKTIGPFWRSPRGQICTEPPRYTESLDAAMMTMPAGMVWRLECCDPIPYVLAIVAVPPAKMVAFPLHSRWHAISSTPAIALLIAILRARETEGK